MKLAFDSRLKELADDAQLREKWTALRQKLMDEFQIVKDLSVEVAGFKVGGM